MSEAVADEPLTRILAGLRDARLGLAIGLIALGILFRPEIETAIKVWIESTAYNHCFLVIPIAGFLIWDRRMTLRGLTAVPMTSAALLALPVGAVWLAAERLGIMEGRQLMAITMVQVLFLAMFGWRLWLALLGPLLYLYFLVPFGEFLTPRLQDITTWFVRHGVDVLGIPAYIDGYVIDIPEGSFFVAAACAGLQFLIASIAFGVLYALLMYRSPGRRVMFIIASIIVPIIANGFRALGIVALGHVLGSAQAAATDHVLYGWIFFSIVILLLILLGLPFRQDEQQEESSSSVAESRVSDPRAARRGLITGVAVAALAALGPIIVLGLNAASAMPVAIPKPLDLSPSCVNVGSPAALAPDAAGRGIVQTVTCGATTMTIHIETFSPRSTAAPITAERRHLTRPSFADDVSEAPLTTKSGEPLRPWRLVRGNDPAFVTAAGVWIDGEPMVPGIALRLLMAKTSLIGAATAPVVVVITPVADWPRVDIRKQAELATRIADLVAARPDLGDQIQAIAKAAR